MRQFVAASAGNVGITFSLSMLPLVTLVGGGLDYSSAITMRQRLAHAIDSAALAVGRAPDVTVQEATEIANRAFNSNLTEYKNMEIGTLSVNVTPALVTVHATASMPTDFLGLVGIDTIEISVSNEVVRSNRKIELVLALDNTGSMGSNGKMNAMKTAAKDLVEILFNGEEQPENVKVGLVPFSQTVNVGSQYKTASWMDTTGLSSINGENFSPKTHHFKLLKRTKNGQWRGCVEARPAPYDTTDAAATTAVPDTLFVPYFAPDEPDKGGSYPNRYLKDKVGGSVAKRQKSTKKYKKKKVNNGGNSRGPNYLCSTPPITPLMNSKSTLVSSINSFYAQGWTHIPMGLSWGWRVLSPGAPFTQGASYDDDENIKAMVLLTDGANTIAPRYNHNKSYYTAYGYLARGRLGTTNKNTAVSILNQKTATLCENIKAAGIRLYTITFDLGNNTAIKNLMRNCASAPSMYFNSPTNAQLQTAFHTIAGDLSKLRLSK
jgi:Flp pilus assembly protein TadG